MFTAVVGVLPFRTDAMFRRYAIVDKEQKREALAKVQQYLAMAPAERKIVRIARRAMNKVRFNDNADAANL